MIEWDAPDERYFHTGCDRGVLYFEGAAVPWNGITGTSESGAGDKTVLYRDGVVYYADVEPGDYEGSLTTYSWPVEFNKALGIPEIAPGLHANYQKPRRFDFSYRTLVGSGTTGDMFGYQIHLFYNVVAAAGQVSRKTLTNTPELNEFSLDLVATPVRLKGFRPTAHFVLDTRGLPNGSLATLESILYEEGRMPRPYELYELLKFGSSIIIVDHGDGTWTASGSSDNIIDHGDGTWEIKNVNGAWLDSEQLYQYQISSTP